MVHTPKPKPKLEILPNTRFLVFEGDQHEAQPVKLSGLVRFTTPDAMSIKNVKLRLEGKRKISWYYMGGMAAGEVTDKRTFWNEERQLGTSGTHKINAGSIEWPFEFELDPSMPESIEGMSTTWLVYNLYASISRPGWNAKDITETAHIRIVRTLGRDQMETTRSRTNSDIWANKLSYSISIPSDAIVFGTSITADVELSPIRKGIRLGKVEMRLLETVTKRIQQTESPDRNDRSKTDESEVAKGEMEFPEHSRVTYDDETPDNPTMEDEKYVFQARLELPKSLRQCRQDVDSHAISITHRFKLMVNIHNPEGHISQLVCRLPVKLFISPNLPVDDNNQIQIGLNGLSDEAINQQEATLHAPPEYGRHQLDALYNDINSRGFMSVAGSGANTPTPFYAQSRNTSSENLQSLNGVADSGQIDSYLLSRRLAGLQEQGSSRQARSSTHHSPSGGNTPHNGLVHFDLPVPQRFSTSLPHSGGGYFPAQTTSSSNRSSPPRESPLHSAPLSRRTSDETQNSGNGTPDDHEVHREDYDMGTLSRVPSYGAALRTPGPSTLFPEQPPSYLDATSRPPSPAREVSIQRPSAAHVRSGASTPNSNSSGYTIGPNGQGLPGGLRGLTPLSPTTAHHHPSLHHDDGAHLRMLRSRDH